ncbi:hypothetical protein HDEF_1544 [Candidatus Hamiltonella defensa 5AT (Acyrthosiphon pisum)]|uniref:Uncharacterized protein n=1 Tax=Hamiltonella defensa subsp. Acyrthosiphon pisum (strain 5AT) TaxID=572265 RepID=C4K6G9_HAMD5|nr:hypothetical protein HDEF_1544 [Candidatus Hamiltonella defensa 5AT (Acyrthosiphon pisum)]
MQKSEKIFCDFWILNAEMNITNKKRAHFKPSRE